MLCFLFVVYFEDIIKSEKLLESKQGKYEIGECFASSPKLERKCFQVNKAKERAVLGYKFGSNIESGSLFLFFTARIKFPSTDSSIMVKLGRKGHETIAGFVYGNDNPRFVLQNQNIMCSNGTVDYDRELTRSIGLVITENGEIRLYVDGIIKHVSNISVNDVFPISNLEIEIMNGNTTSEIGNIYVSNDEKQRWPMLIKSLLQFRAIERASVLRELVDEEERRLFGDSLIKEPLDMEEEYGVLLDENEADPRRFPFPLKLNFKSEKSPKKESDDSPNAIQKRIEISMSKSRTMEEDEKEEL